MNWTRVLTRIPGRWLAPLLLMLLVFLVAGSNYLLGAAAVGDFVTGQESHVLSGRLAVEQARLDQETGAGNPLLVRGLVTALGLQRGLDQAYLLSPQGRIEASLARADSGRELAALPGVWPARLHALLAQHTQAKAAGIRVLALPGAERLVGLVPIQGGRWLVVSVDISLPLAQRLRQLRLHALQEMIFALAAAALLAVLLHLIWFRRASQLVHTLAAIGRGQFAPRSGLQGRDELALIGTEVDRLADRLQTDQAEIRRLHSVVNRSPVVAIEWGHAPGWPVLYVSDALARWGYAKADWLGGRWTYAELIHPDDIARVRAQVQHHVENGLDEYRHEYRLRRADGSWAWVVDRTHLRRDASGTVVGSSGILVDITEQKQAEQTAREQSESLRLFYDLPFIGMALGALDTPRWLQVNDRLCDILGYPRQELLTLPWADLTHPADLPAEMVLFEDLLQGRRDGYWLHKRFLRPDGQVVDAEIDVRALRRQGGGVRQLLATVQDVTERTQSTRTLQHYKEMLEQAGALVKLGSWVLDTDSLHLRVSAQFFRNLGLEPAARPPTDAQYLERIHPQDRDRAAQDLHCIRSGRDVGELLFRTNPAHGPMRWLRRTAQRIAADSGAGVGYVGSLQDVTEAIEMQQRLQNSNQELEQRVQERTAQLSAANRELESFSYAVSHDLRSPLRGIAGYSQLLQEEYGSRLDADGQRYIERIRDGIGQMSQLISDLLDYAHLERRRMEAAPVDLRALLAQVLEGCASDIERCGTTLEQQVAPLTLPVDRDGLALVLRNLIGNAIKFSARSAQPRVQVGARSENGRCILWVRDNGVGFDMQYHDRVFGIFQRLHRTEDYAGTGVGLALVTKAVQRMGGRVWAESAPGAGATFFLDLPL